MFDFQGQQPSTNLTVEQLRTCLEKVEMSLLLEPSIKSAIVRLTQDKLVAYVATFSRSLDLTEIHKYLQNLIPLEWMPHVFIPLVALPFNSLGEIDELTLSNIPVVDNHLAAKWEELIRQQPDIEDVAVVVSDRPKQPLPLHLSDLLPDWVGIQSKHPQNQSELISASSDNALEIKSDRLAISHGATLQITANAPLTLADALKQAASKSPDHGLTYIANDGIEITQSYPELLEKAQSVMAGLRELGLQPQDKVIFQLKDNSDFLAAFWGCILGGFVPVPLSLASDYRELNNNVKKLHYTWELLDQPIILTNQRLVSDIRSITNFCTMNNLEIASIEDLLQYPPDLLCHDSQPDDLAMLLLTSGSTGIPKAVMQTHNSILKQAQTTIQMNGFSHSDIYLNWMPLDHVGGIIFAHCNALYIACQQVHVPTDFILNAPLRWMDLMSSYRATITWAPNFAYNLVNNCLLEIDENVQRDWDLSSMRYVLSAGEAIVPRIARQFLQLLNPYGLPETALHSAWGMAETCSGAFYSDRFLYTFSNEEETFAEVGPPVPGFSVQIVDLKEEIVHEGTIGLVQVKGGIVTIGYYRNSSANQDAFSTDGWFNTGDLGILREGRLTITGRQKDVIIINGTNYYSHEIEGFVEEIKGVASSFTAAVGVRDGGDTDRLVIFFSPISQDELAIVKLIPTIRDRVLKSSGIYPDYVVPIELIAIPKTAIGKIQRSQLKQQFEAGDFNNIIKQFDILSANANTLPDWFFRKIWCRQECRPLTMQQENRSVMIFLDRLGLGESLDRTLSTANHACIKVAIGKEFTRFSADYYAIAPNNPTHYQQLLESLEKDGFSLTDILHLWTYDASQGEISNLEELEKSQEYGLYSLLFLVQALVINNQARSQIRLKVISSQAQAVINNEAIAYEKTPLLGITKAIPSEIHWLHSQHIDLSHSLTSLSTHTDLIFQELSTLSTEPEIAFRDGQRLVSRLEKVDFSQSPKQKIPFKQGGAYLLTGGLGGIGLEIATYLLQKYQARLLIVGRTPLPPKSSWDEHLQTPSRISDKIRAYQTLEEIDSNIIYQTADITNLEIIKPIVTQAQNQWQSHLDGIIHLAGLYHESNLVDETQSTIAEILKPKMAGTWVLNQILKNNPDSIFIGFSSIISFFSGSMLGAYAAANCFLEGFSHYQRHQQLSSYCFSWSMWDEIGMSQGYEMKELIRAKGRYTLTSQQGLLSLIAGLHYDCSQLIVGLESTNSYIREYIQKEPYNLYELIAFVKSSQSIFNAHLDSLTVNDVLGTSSHCRLVRIDEMPTNVKGEIDHQKLHDRLFNHNQGEQISPRNAAERQIAKIWQDILKVSQISINDNFFELGGQSLLATQVTSRIREVFRLDLELSSFFKAPTIAGVVNSLAKQAPSSNYIDKVAELREKISTMSTKEIQDRLHKSNIPLS